MPQEQLRYRVSADTKQFEAGMAKVRSAQRSSTKGTRKQGLAFTQLAYALDDAQYGFRGVQNNIQQLAVQAGLGGPLVLGITALTIGLGYLIEKTNLFASATNAANKSSQKFIDTLAEELGLIDKLAKTQEEGLDQIKENNKRLERINEIEAKQIRNGKELQSVFVKEREELKKKNETIAYLLGLQSSRDDADKTEAANTKRKAEELKAYNAELARLKDQADLPSFSLNQDSFFNNQDSELNVFKLFGINPNEPTVVSVDDILVLDESDLDIFGGKFEDEIIPQAEEKIGNLGQALQSGLQNAFVGLGNSIGEALKGENIGEAFLGVLAGFMQSFGAALIALGVAKLTLESNLPGGVLIAAGVGLVAAATLLKPGGAGNYTPSGGGSNGGLRSNIQATPVSAQGSGNGSQTVIRGDQVRYLQQQQNNTYRGRN